MSDSHICSTSGLNEAMAAPQGTEENTNSSTTGTNRRFRMAEGGEWLQSDVFRSIMATGFYAFMSGAMAFMNKNLVSNYNFNCPMFILLIQFLILVFSFEVMKFCRVVTLSSYTIQLGEHFQNCF